MAVVNRYELEVRVRGKANFYCGLSIRGWTREGA